MSLLWRSIVVVLFISLVFTFSLFTTTYDQPATKSKIFQETTQKLDSVSALAPYLDGDTLQVGWAAVNITPADNPSLAGYGQGKLKTVIDSIYIKTFVFSNGPFKIALITADLLIFPPLVKQLVNKSIAALGVDGIYYTATHTHHSIGNWQPGLVGYLFAGPYEEKTVSELANACKESIIEAQKNMAPSSLAFAALQSDHVYNRIDPQLGTIDPWIRVLFISQSEKKAIISSFSAHPTTIDRNNLFLHQEYPGVLVRKLEKSHAEIASFVAGAMGSQGPKRLAIESDLTREIGNSIYEQVHMISNVVTGEFESAIGFLELEIPLNEPQWRISNDFRLRPWAFDLLFGEYKASISLLRLGQNLIIGLPADFSGELMQAHEMKARQLGINLIITSFNGDYIGYITKDSWYEKNHYETRVMNWFGPGYGEYFNRVIDRLIDWQAQQ